MGKRPKTQAIAIREGVRQLGRLCMLRPTVRSFLQSALRIARGGSIERLVLRNGMVLCGPPNHPLLQMAEEIFHARLYTPDGWDLQAGGVVVDVGANIGIFSVMAAERRSNRVIAFEPHPENLRFLRRNVSANRMVNVTVCESAVSDQGGWQRLYVNTNAAGHSLCATPAVDNGREVVRVPTTTLPEIMEANHLDRVDFLKIDCEGSEGAILLSTPAGYLKRIGRLAIEFHDNVSVIAHDQMQDLLEKHGFITALKWDGVSPFGFLYACRNGVSRDAHCD